MDIVGFGALNYDRLLKVEKIAKEGEEVGSSEVRESSGGSAANTIVGLARLGVKTGFAGIVGNDNEGRIILNNFDDEGIDTSTIAIANGRTGTVMGCVDTKGERTLYVYPGVNNDLKRGDINIGYLKRAKFVHLTSFVNEKQLKVQTEIIKNLSEAVKISFAPGMIYAKMGIEKLRPIIKRSYVIFLSKEEILALTGKNNKKGSKILEDEGAKIVAVTLGERGGYIITGDNDIYEPRAHSKNVIDTTGAGDAFASGFLYGLLKKWDINVCGEFGSLLASFCIRKFGARKGLPYKDNESIKEFLKMQEQRKLRRLPEWYD